MTQHTLFPSVLQPCPSYPVLSKILHSADPNPRLRG